MPDKDSNGENGSRAPEQSNFQSPDAGTVPLSGYLEGPFVHPDADVESMDRFRLRQTPDAQDYIEVSWWNIRWIDDYPHPEFGESGWDKPENLGKRIVWVEQDLRLAPGGFLAGEIAQNYMPQVDTTSIVEAWGKERERRRDGITGRPCSPISVEKCQMCSRPACMCTTMPDYDTLDIPRRPDM